MSVVTLGSGDKLKPAWYIIRSESSWARWLNLLHLPYTLWHLSYVVIGAALAGSIDISTLGATLLAFFLGMGIAAHAFDLMADDPLRLGFHSSTLALVGGVSLALAVTIGLYCIISGEITPWLSLALPAGATLAVGYGLEWKYLHGDWQFPIWWAVFPLLVGYLAQDTSWNWAIIPAMIFAFCTAYVQRSLSTRSRFLRRKVSNFTVNVQESPSGAWRPLGTEWLLSSYDTVLAILTLNMVLLALIFVIYS